MTDPNEFASHNPLKLRLYYSFAYFFLCIFECLFLVPFILNTNLNVFSAPSMKVHLLLHFVYLSFSFYQVKKGLPTLGSFDYQSDKIDNLSAYFILIVRSFPFFTQISVLFKWAFTATSLKYKDWIFLERFYYKLTLSRFINYTIDQRTVIGFKRKWIEKVGNLLLWFTLLVGILIGPLVLFSNVFTGLTSFEGEE